MAISAGAIAGIAGKVSGGGGGEKQAMVTVPASIPAETPPVPIQQFSDWAAQRYAKTVLKEHS